jgi:hypothetical protein
MPAIPGLADIPSNFNVNDWIVVSAGASAQCLSSATEGEGKLRFLCAPAHIGYNDPILYPGREGAAHLHSFFGNPGVDHNSTYARLRAGMNFAGVPNTTGNEGTCSGRGNNRTGYWFPTLIKPASEGFPVPKVVIPSLIEMYYANAPYELDDYVSANPLYPHTTYKMGPFPNGFQMVFGWEHQHPIPAPSGVWGRENLTGAAGTTRQGTLQDLAVYAPYNAVSAGGYWDNIFARINSPNCWDGVNLTSVNGRSHIASKFQDSYGKLICPASHPYQIPSLTVIIFWSNNGPDDWKNWYLSVDRHTGHNLAGGHGFHTDWFGAWDPGIQTIWEEEHLALGTTAAALAGKTSVSGNLCRDDWVMNNASTLTGRIPNGIGNYFLPEASRYMDIPAVPGQRRMRLSLALSQRNWVAEGDSITAAGGGGYAATAEAAAVPDVVNFTIQAVGGSGINSVIARAAATDALLVTGGSNILSVLIGANGISGSFLTDLAGYLDARRAAGWHVILCTVLPTTIAGFNTTRATVNAELRFWTVSGSGGAVFGKHADRICDFAADPTMGTDAAASNTTYYVDGVHPTTAGHAILRKVFQPVLDAAQRGIADTTRPTITSSATGSSSVGVPFTRVLTANESCTWSVSGAGFSISLFDTLQHAAGSPGTFPCTVTARDGSGNTTTQSFSLTVA